MCGAQGTTWLRSTGKSKSASSADRSRCSWGPSGADLARCATAGPRFDRRVGWCPRRGELQREPKRDRHHPRRASTPALSGPSYRGAQPDADRCGCGKLRGESTSRGLRRSNSASAETGPAPVAQGACASRARADPRSPSERASADQPTAGLRRKQSDPLGLQGREPHELEPDSFP